MRPVNRGPCPIDESGDYVRFREYGYAKPYLTRRMGDYCSFCEMPLSAALAVEHIRHKHNNPDLRCEWSNFLLACPSCNSTKGTKVDTKADVDRHLWPHEDRTFEVFIYTLGGIVRLADHDDPVFSARAKATLDLVGLTRLPGAGLKREQILRGSDNRYRKRSEVWDEASAARQDLRELDTPVVRRRILASARARGFWSVWMTVFSDDEQMQAALCQEQAFAGTARARLGPLPVGAPAQDTL